MDNWDENEENIEIDERGGEGDDAEDTDEPNHMNLYKRNQHPHQSQRQIAKAPLDMLYTQKIQDDIHECSIIAQMAEFWLFSKAGIPLHAQSEVIPDESRLNDFSSLATKKHRQVM
jgi:hypothetical protein